MWKATVALTLALAASHTLASASNRADRAPVLFGHTSNTVESPAGLPVERDTQLPFAAQLSLGLSELGVPFEMSKHRIGRMVFLCEASIDDNHPGTIATVYGIEEASPERFTSSSNYLGSQGARYAILHSRPMQCATGVLASVADVTLDSPLAGGGRHSSSRAHVYKATRLSDGVFSLLLAEARTRATKPPVFLPIEGSEVSGFRTLAGSPSAGSGLRYGLTFDAVKPPKWAFISATGRLFDGTPGLHHRIAASRGVQGMIARKYVRDAPNLDDAHRIGRLIGPASELASATLVCRSGEAGVSAVGLTVEREYREWQNPVSTFAYARIPMACKKGPLLTIRKGVGESGTARSRDYHVGYYVFASPELSDAQIVYLMGQHILPAYDSLLAKEHSTSR